MEKNGKNECRKEKIVLKKKNGKMEKNGKKNKV